MSWDYDEVDGISVRYYTGSDAYHHSQNGIIAYSKNEKPISAKYGTYAEFLRIIRPLQANGTHKKKIKSVMVDYEEHTTRNGIFHSHSEIWNICQSKRASLPDVEFYVVAHYREPKVGPSRYLFEAPRKGHAEYVHNYLKVLRTYEL